MHTNAGLFQDARRRDAAGPAGAEDSRSESAFLRQEDRVALRRAPKHVDGGVPDLRRGYLPEYLFQRKSNMGSHSQVLWLPRSRVFRFRACIESLTSPFAEDHRFYRLKSN